MFKNLDEVEAYGLALLNEYLPPGLWEFRWGSAKKQHGVCDFMKKYVMLSRPIAQALLDRGQPEEVEDTVKHEVAHACADSELWGRPEWDSEPSHGSTWQTWARKLGARLETKPPVPVELTGHPWIGLCTAGHQYERWRAPSSPGLCRRDGCRLKPPTERFIWWRKNGRFVKMPKSYLEDLELGVIFGSLPASVLRKVRRDG